MIYMLTSHDKATQRLQHENYEPLGLEDFEEFPIFKDADMQLGVIPAHGGNIMFLPVVDNEEYYEEVVPVNQPATSHSVWGSDAPILESVAVLVTDIEDGFIDPRWAVGPVILKEHEEGCLFEEHQGGITYIVHGPNEGTYLVTAIDDDDEEEGESE